MRTYVTITGMKDLQQKLKAISYQQKKKNEEDVVVGFSQNYAMFVHEISAYHEVGEEKYLEKAFRRLRGEIPRIVATIYKHSQSLTMGLLVAGLRIQKEAQKLTPVDTGALKASAYTAKEKNMNKAAKAAAGRAWNKQQQAKHKRG